MNKRHPQKNKSSLKLPLILLFVLVALIAAMVVGIVAFLKFYTPDLDDETPFDTDTSYTDTEGEEDYRPFIRDTESVNFLIIGQDLKSWKTDVMMLVNFDMAEGSLSLMQIPRDTFVNSASDGVRGKINNLMYKKSKQAYSEKSNPTEAERISAGMQGAVEFLEKRLCIQIDGYALVNLEGFRNVVDIIGGVPINVPADMHYDDPDQDLYIDLKAGPQVLNGETAEMFVRFRSGYVNADIGRGDAQKLFLAALFKKLTESIDITTIPKLVGEAFKHVYTDLALADIVYYTKELLGVDMSKFYMLTLPGNGTSNYAHYVLYRADVLNIVNTYFNVYDTPITDEMFDSDRIFTDETDENYLSIYLTPATELIVHTADEVDSEGIHIPRKHNG